MMARWLAISVTAMTVVMMSCDCDRHRAGGDENQDEVQFTSSEQWSDEPKRIVSMAPNITELLFELDMGDRVVAVTRYCDWPPEVEQLPTIGGMLDPDYEAILAAEPDVVIGVEGGADHRVVERLEQANVAYGFLHIDDLTTIRAGTQKLGEWLGAEARAEELVRQFDAELQRASSSVRQSLESEEATAILVFDREPVVAAGTGTFGDQILQLAGLENAVPRDAGAYPVLDIEQVLAMNPEVIIDVKIEAGSSETVLEYWRQFESLRAVESGRIVQLDDPVMMRPGPRIPEALDRLGQAVEEL